MLSEQTVGLDKPKTAKINDFVIRFANVNGTGSASANFLFAKAIFRMGVPVTPKNIFPSNIQGLPTWYEVRVSQAGWLGRREGVDFMVSVNPQSMAKDIAGVKPGGYFMYDSSKPLYEEYIRPDITYFGVPMMRLCAEAFEDSRKRQLFKNVVYVGALAELLGIEYEVFEDVLRDQFKGKDKLIEPNLKAIRMGIDYVKEYFDYPLEIGVERRDLLGDKIMIDGNTACGLGAVYGGATVCTWYPITPATSVAENFNRFGAKYRIDSVTGKKNYAFVQAEDELAAVGMAIGAGWNGARAFTSTSGAGISLMNEFIGLAYFAEIPVVIIDVQRTGPSTGMPTRTQQSDLFETAYASHGDTKHLLLFPSTPKECFEMTAQSFDIADYFQTPVFVLSDLDLGMNDHISDSFRWDDSKMYNRGKVLSKEDLENMTERYGRFLDVDDDGVTYRTLPGTHPSKGAVTARGTSKDEFGIYTEDGEAYKRNVDRLLKKFNTAKSFVPEPEIYQEKNRSASGIIFFGTSIYAAEEALHILEEQDVMLDALRVRAFPFNDEIKDFIDSHEAVYVVEQNRDAQLRSMFMMELGIHPEKLISVLNYNGMPITADDIIKQIVKEN